MPGISSVRYAIRALARSPWLTVVIVVTLGLGIGVTTTVFTVVNAVLLRPLPFPEGERLVRVWSADPANPKAHWISFPDFLDVRSQSRTIETLAAWFGYELVHTGAGDPERITAAVVVGDLFGVLGTPASLGATLPAGQETSALRVVLSHQFWQRRFDGDPDVIGRGITLNDGVYTIVGVMPADFRFPIQTPPVDVWASLPPAQSADAPLPRNARTLDAIGRLRPGVDPARAGAELEVIAANLAREFPASNVGIGLRVLPARDHVAQPLTQPLWVLFAAVCCVLLIACVNVADLLLARGATRGREMALRAALGGGRFRIAAQLTIEALVLAAGGGFVGWMLALWGVDLLLALVPADLPRAGEVSIDWRVLAFTLGTSLATGLGFGVAPALHASKVDLSTAIRDNGRTASAGRRGRRVRGVLVVSQIALAMILTTAASLFITSFLLLRRTPAGIVTQNVLTFEVTWPWERYSAVQAARAFDELQRRLNAISGVAAAAAGLQLPDRGGTTDNALLPYLGIAGRTAAATERPRTAVTSTQPGYFRVLGIPMLAGRDFTPDDGADAPPVVVVNDSLARRFFPGENPLGKRIALESPLLGRERPLREIVGVAADVTHHGAEAAMPFVYVPLAQLPFNTSHVVVKTSGETAAILAAIRESARTIDPNLALYDVQLLEDRIAATIARDRFTTLLVTLFSAMALGLAVVGLYGILSYSVAQRTREMAIRLGLGARPRDALQLILTDGLRLVGLGLALGVAGALTLSRVVEGMLYGVAPSDPATLLRASGVLVVVAVLTCWIPARRAARVDPMTVLRTE